MCDLLKRIRYFATVRPKAIALRQGELRLSYAALSAAADGVAGGLRAVGVAAGDAIAICYPRSFEQIVGALGVMRAGGAYVPLDPGWPRERLRGILEDSGARVLLAPREMGNIGAASVIEVGEGSEGANGDDAWSDDGLAYIIYTSGSTGAPKGVEITHGNLAHLIAWHVGAFGVTDGDRGSHLAGLGFDASVWEVWPYLAAGACVSLVADEVRTSAALLQNWLVAEEITVAFVPTPLAEPMIAMDWPVGTKLRFLLTGGDCLHHGPRTGLPFAVVNNYGPTECTVVATSGVVAAGEVGMPSIGRAIAGARVYVLDERGEEAVDGELWIGGGGVGRGYRGLGVETARSFVESSRGRLYRTGDFGCLLADGQIGFRGRTDGQVKIRGQRMELEEIVCALNRHAGVVFSTVAAAGEGEEKHLVGYVLGREGVELSGRDLREFLLCTLPDHMIPAVFVRLTELPLTANGKVDRGALPEVNEGNRLGDISRGAASAVEEVLLGLVRTLLKTDAVGVEDDFFLLGGHSLMGTRLVMRIREAFGVRMTLRDLFEAKTVALLAAQVEAMLLAEVEAMSEEEAAAQVNR